LAKAPKTHDKVTLAVFDDPRRGGELFPHLDRRVGSWAADTLRACKEGAHQAYRGDLARLVENTRDLIRRVLTRPATQRGCASPRPRGCSPGLHCPGSGPGAPPG